MVALQQKQTANLPVAVRVEHMSTHLGFLSLVEFEISAQVPMD